MPGKDDECWLEKILDILYDWYDWHQTKPRVSSKNCTPKVKVEWKSMNIDINIDLSININKKKQKKNQNKT